jgi:AbiU2
MESRGQVGQTTSSKAHQYFTWITRLVRGVMARRRNRRIAAKPNVGTDVQFEHELEVFRTQAETAAQFFYGYLAIHAAAGEKNSIYRLLNTAPLFWNTILGALQTAAFVALGRIFDQDSAHNLGRLLRLAQDNPQLFSKAALAKRKQGAANSPPKWLNEYLRHAYVTKAADFRRLRGHVSKQRKIYLTKYQPLRHQVFAHTALSDATDISALFLQTNIREMQRMLTFLMSFHEAMWQLFVNGHRPVLRPRRYSVARMRERVARNARARSAHERLVYEAERFLQAASGKVRGI